MHKDSFRYGAKHDEKRKKTSHSLVLQNILESELCVLAVNRDRNPCLYYISPESQMSCEKHRRRGESFRFFKCTVEFFKNNGLVHILQKSDVDVAHPIRAVSTAYRIDWSKSAVGWY